MVDPAAVRAWLDADEAVLVDVREEREALAERIAGSHALPLSRFDPRRLPETAGRHLVIHCRSGQRCGMAASLLVRAGHVGPIHRMQGGLMAWKRLGLPVETGGPGFTPSSR